MSETFKVKVKRTETYTATVELVAETQQQADERIRDRLDAEGWEDVLSGTDGDLCDSWSEVLGAGSPQTVIVRALQSVADLIEATYDHDEDGNRTDMDCPMSGADVTESLMGMETAIFEALEQAKTSADVFAIVRELVAWESQQGGWEAPCWDRGPRHHRRQGRSRRRRVTSRRRRRGHHIRTGRHAGCADRHAGPGRGCPRSEGARLPERWHALREPALREASLTLSLRPPARPNP